MRKITSLLVAISIHTFWVLLVVSVGMAQESELQVTVQSTNSFEASTGLYTYNYSFTNLGSSRQSVWRISLRFPGGMMPDIRNVTSPQGWTPGLRNREPMIRWAATGIISTDSDDASTFRIPPGQTLAGFSFRSMDPPGAVDYTVIGWTPLPEVNPNDEDSGDEEPSLPGPLNIGVSGSAQGPAVPASTPRPSVYGFLRILSPTSATAQAGNVLAQLKFALAGEAVDRDSLTASLNGIDVTSAFATAGAGADRQASFSFGASPLRPGGNVLATTITGTNPAGGGTAVDLDRVSFQFAPFSDVAGSDFYFEATNRMLRRSITTGCSSSPLQYCPAQNVTRGQMAVFVVRSIVGGDSFSHPTTPYFTDVSANHQFFKWIQKMRELGITSGCATDRYCPDDAVSRGQMAAFIIRMRMGGTATFAFPGTPFFNDVPGAHPFFGAIQKMRDTGITSGCAANRYCPDDPVTRGQMAIFLVRGGFNELLAVKSALVNSISPRGALGGQSVNVAIVGENTNFVQGTTQVNIGPGVTVTNVVVSSATLVRAQVTVATAAMLGPRSIIVKTGSEEAILPNSFTVLQGQ